MRERTLAAALRIGREIGDSRVLTDPEVIERFGRDESEQPARTPDAVVLPHDAPEACASIRIASEAGVAITPRAGGTGKSGGAVPVHGGIVLACDHLAAIKEIDPVDMVTVVEPGVVLGRLHQEVEAQGLFYPPDPASLDSCCLGGNVAENAGGPRAFKYGVTSQYVLALDLVIPDGRLMSVGHRPIKGVAGYDLAKLLVGSEGTLGFITGITLRLLPRPPEICTMMALFVDLVSAGRGIGAILAAGILPRVLEIMDRECVETVRDSGAAVPPEAEALVMLELDGVPRAVEEEMQRCGDVLDDAGAREVLVATGAVERQRLWRARRELSEALSRRRAHKIADDISVPRSRLVDTLAEIEAIAKRSGLTAATFGHAGDGNLHVNFLWDESGLDAAAESARASVLRMAIANGGTISGEHGIGSVKRRYLAEELGRTTMELSGRLKNLIDPTGIMNAGKLF